MADGTEEAMNEGESPIDQYDINPVRQEDFGESSRSTSEKYLNLKKIVPHDRMTPEFKLNENEEHILRNVGLSEDNFFTERYTVQPQKIK